MDISISHLKFWYPNCEKQSIEQTLKMPNDVHEWPKLDFVPAIQRRRLSPFAKIALYVAHQATLHTNEKFPIIFSSRHGDLHKTSGLLTDISNKSPLSPTAFSLSVHNAIPSLYSIFTENKEALNAISAEKNTFFMSIVDAYARLTSGLTDKVLFIHADQKLPDTYMGFKDEIQLSHAVSMLITLPSGSIGEENSHHVSVNMTHKPSIQNSHLPAALTFAQWLKSNKMHYSFDSTQYHWSAQKHVQ